MRFEGWLTEPLILWTAQLVVWLALLLTCLYCVRKLEHLKHPPLTLSEVQVAIHMRLAQLLPLPFGATPGVACSMLDDVAPGRPRAVFTAGEPPLLVARCGGDEAPQGDDARWVEIHRPLLSLGRSVHEECGTLLPALTGEGRLAGAVLVRGTQEIVPDERARGALRYLAGLLRVALTLDQLAEVERERLRWQR